MNKLKNEIYVSSINNDGDIIAVSEDTPIDDLPYAAIAGSSDCFHTMNLKKGNYILFKAIDAITIEGGN